MKTAQNEAGRFHQTKLQENGELLKDFSTQYYYADYIRKRWFFDTIGPVGSKIADAL